MATSDNSVLCSICMVKNLTNISKSWCPECDDALCAGCYEYHSISKATRNHNLLPIEDYMKLPSFLFNLKLDCDEHCEKYLHYCKNHEAPLCMKCITRTPRECKDVCLLTDVTENIKTSYTFEAIQRDCESITRIIKGMRNNRQKSYTRFKHQKHEILKQVSQVRDAVNQHLDSIATDLLDHLDSESNKHCKQTEDLIHNLEEKEKRMEEMQNNLSKIMKYASNFQTFLLLKQMEKLVHTEEEYIQLAGDDGSLNQMDICCDINKEIRDITEKIKTFGNIRVEYTPTVDNLNSLRENQAQSHLTKKRTEVNKQIKLLRRFDMLKVANIGMSCCCLISNGDMVFGEFRNKAITVYNKFGTERCKTTFKRSVPIAIAEIDDKTVAVSVGIKIVLIDAVKGEKTRTMIIGIGIWGITYKDGQVTYCRKDKGVGMIDLHTSKSTMLLQEKLQKGPSYVTALSGRRYAFTKSGSRIVRVIDFAMHELQIFSQKDLLQDPRHIFADTEDSLYVLDWKTRSIVFISHDGINYSVLQCDDFRFKTIEMAFNSNLSQLLVYTNERDILLFGV